MRLEMHTLVIIGKTSPLSHRNIQNSCLSARHYLSANSRTPPPIHPSLADVTTIGQTSSLSLRWVSTPTSPSVRLLSVGELLEFPADVVGYADRPTANPFRPDFFLPLTNDRTIGETFVVGPSQISFTDASVLAEDLNSIGETPCRTTFLTSTDDVSHVDVYVYIHYIGQTSPSSPWSAGHRLSAITQDLMWITSLSLIAFVGDTSLQSHRSV